MFFNEKNEKIVFASCPDPEKTLVCICAGVTYPNPDYRIVREPSADYVFEYVINGAGYIETAGKTIKVEAGMFYLYRKGAELVYYADPSDPYEKIWANMDGDIIGRMLDVFALGDIYTSHANVYEMFLSIHDKLQHIDDENSPIIYSEILSIMFSILNEAAKADYFPSQPEKYGLDEKIKAYIDANIYADISLDTISEKFGITKMHIIRVFKKRYGDTPMQYLINKKIIIAQSLLAGTMMPIKEIAALLRYSNTQHFSSSFKTAVGCTPNKFRQMKNR